MSSTGLCTCGEIEDVECCSGMFDAGTSRAEPRLLGFAQPRTQPAAEIAEPQQQGRFDRISGIGRRREHVKKFKSRGEGRKKFRHSIATMEMEAFRPHPEKRVTCWIPLRPATSCPEDSFGSIQLAVTYSDDYVAQGYMFGLFCGLAPFSLSHLWAHEPLFKLSGSADDVRSDRLRSPRRSLSSSERRGYSAPPIIPATAAGPNGLTSASNESEESGMLAALASGPGASTVST